MHHILMSQFPKSYLEHMVKQRQHILNLSQ